MIIGTALLGAARRRNAVSAPVIADANFDSGKTFPGNAVSVTGGVGARDWRVNGVSTGQTGTTFAPRVQDIGLPVKCIVGGVDSNVLTCWHPSDVPQVKSCRVPWQGVLNTVGPDVPATVGQTVRRWNDVINGWQGNQTEGSRQPILRESGGMRYLESDGVNDSLLLDSPDEKGLFNNAAQRWVLLAARERDPFTTPPAYRTPISFLSANTYVLSMYLKNSATTQIYTVYKNTAPNQVSLSCGDVRSSQHAIYTAMVSIAPTGGHTAFRINGSQVAAAPHNVTFEGPLNPGWATLFSARAASDNYQDFSGTDMYFQAAGDANLDAVSRSRIERFAMLCMGSNYSGPNIPLVP